MKSRFKKSYTKLLPLLLLIIVGYITPLSVEAEESNYLVDTDSDFWVNENGVLFDYRGSGGDVVIPTNVTSIGNGAFSFCSDVTSITIPNTVTTIGIFAFNDCTSLASITIPNSVTSIGDYAFNNCSSLTSTALLKC